MRRIELSASTFREFGTPFLRAGPRESELHSVGSERLLTVGSQIRLWDLKSEVEVARFEPTKGRITAFAINSDETSFACALDVGAVVVVRVADGVVEERFERTVAPAALAFSPDGKYLAVGGGGHGRDAVRTVTLYERGCEVPGDTTAELKGTRTGITDITFSPDGAFVAACGDRRVRLWALPLTKKNKPLSLQHTDPVYNVRFIGDGQTLYTLTKTALSAWDHRSGNRRWTQQREGHKYAFFRGIQTTQRGVLTGFDTKLIVFDETNGEQVAEWDQGQGAVHSIAVMNEVAYVSSKFRGRVRRFLHLDGTELSEPEGPDTHVRSLCVAADGASAFSGGADGKAEVWDLLQGCRRTLIQPGPSPRSKRVHAACFMPGDDVTVAFGACIGRYDSKTGTKRWEVEAHTTWITLIAVSDNGDRILVCDEPGRRSNGHISIRDAASGEERKELTLSQLVRHAIAKPEGVLLIGPTGTLLIDPQECLVIKETRFLKGFRSSRGALSSDGALYTTVIPSASKEAPRNIVDIERHKVISTLALGEGGEAVAFTLDDRVLVSGDREGLCYWDVETGQCLDETKLPGHPDLVCDSKNGLFVSTREGALYLIERPALEPSERSVVSSKATRHELDGLLEAESTKASREAACEDENE